MPKNLHVGISYSNCRKSKTNRKILKKKLEGGKPLAIEEQGSELPQSSRQKPCKQEERKVKYFKY